MNYPEYAKVNEKLYKINTDFRNAIRCNEVANDKTINDYERALAIIYILFGEEGLNAYDDYEQLLEKGQKYLLCNKELEENDEKPDMDFIEDMDYIEASFMSDYHIDLANVEMHWWKFNNLMNGLSNSEFGDCCVLNRVRNLRNYDVKDIKDKKERDKIIKAKKQVELKKYKKENKITAEQEKSMEELNRIIGI